MSREPSWEDLVEELKKIRHGAEPLRAQWHAYVGSEDYGIWFFRFDGLGTEELRAAFSLIAARAIEKLGILPIPIPQPSQNFPDWRLDCQLVEEMALAEGKPIDLGDAVPFGLGVVDRDAVDPCSRAWLELLRRESTAFRPSGSGPIINKGRQSKFLSGAISDVCGASAVYFMQRARDEIGTQLINRLGQTGPTADDNTTTSPEPDAAQTPQAVPAQSSLPGYSISIDLVPHSEETAQAEQRGIPSVGPPDKGNLHILRGRDGKLAKYVNLDIASRFGGVSRRAIEKAIKKGSLRAEGERLNRRIYVQSLLKYFPSENNAN
jgi:hypothetical protein